MGCHASLFVPGRALIAQADEDWPLTLYPGSLNIRVDSLPPQLKEKGLPASVEALDNRLFAPAFEIRRDQFGNNKLRPTPEMPRRGDAQVWRAKIMTDGREIVECWVLRRFGSRVEEQLEIVANRRLRGEGPT